MCAYGKQFIFSLQFKLIFSTFFWKNGKMPSTFTSWEESGEIRRKVETPP
jgi:hypothetical protein